MLELYDMQSENTVIINRVARTTQHYEPTEVNGKQNKSKGDSYFNETEKTPLVPNKNYQYAVVHIIHHLETTMQNSFVVCCYRCNNARDTPELLQNIPQHVHYAYYRVMWKR